MDIENTTLQILRTVLEREDIDHTCSKETCEEWDSLRQLNIAFALEEKFNVLLSPEEIMGLSSFDSIVSNIKTKLNI